MRAAHIKRQMYCITFLYKMLCITFGVFWSPIWDAATVWFTWAVMRMSDGIYHISLDHDAREPALRGRFDCLSV